MSLIKPWMALVLIACCTLVPVLSPAHADGDVASTSAAGLADAAGESWVGAAAAIGCGWMTRATIATGGAFVGTIAGALATCALMILDAIFT